MQQRIQQLLKEMTVEEKASLLSGADTWHTAAIPRLGIPAVMVSDGPHGLRKQVAQADHLGLHKSIKAVCFPAASAMACSFNRTLLRQVGEALGDECQAEDVAVLLGPGANIKRSPLCGRSFEYFSEDPYLSSHMAASFIEGVQSRGVGTSLKHFLANNQETRRMTVDARIAPRPLREIYLASFEHAVRQAKPATVMCSYNRLNGEYVGESHFALTEVLRQNWGYDGLVLSDWGAVNERAKALAAGLDLEMPGSHGEGQAAILAALEEGTLTMARLDEAAARVLRVALEWQEKRTGKPCDWQAHHALARRVEEESIVLLKNEGALPLATGGRYAFIGSFAKSPRYQGGGSSHINASRVESALEAAAPYAELVYAEGCAADGGKLDAALLAEALDAAAGADAAVVFAGLPDSFESEGFDRETLDMPPAQCRLIEELARVQPNLVVVLHNGAPVAMPWLPHAAAVVEAYLGGQAVGGAVADVLFGRVNPSGKLAESFPLRLEDNPSYLNFPGTGQSVDYAEGLYVGYRYYDAKRMPVLFPFGHGLSYTRFEYENIGLSATEITDCDTLGVSVLLTNTGSCTGKEVVQLYVAPKGAPVARPEKELKGFEKLELAPGETGRVTFALDKRAFAVWDEAAGDWVVHSGQYDILVGGSSRSLPLKATLWVQSSHEERVSYSLNSPLSQVLAHPLGRQLLQPRLDAFLAQLGKPAPQAAEIAPGVNGARGEQAAGAGAEGPAQGEEPAGDDTGAVQTAASRAEQQGLGNSKMLHRMLADLPLRGLNNFSGGAVTLESLRQLCDAMNAQPAG